jgi:sugar porter (SP) family MFS transporter
MRFGNLLGRRWAIFVGCTIVTIGAILQFSAFGLPQLIVGRLVCGMGTGINTSTVPVWQAECTKPHQRGPAMAFGTSMVIAGVMVSYWIDFGFSYIEPSSAAWRVPVAFQIIFAIFVMATILKLPESPRWLILKDRSDEATDVVSALYDLPAEDPLVAEQLYTIHSTLHMSMSSSFREMFRSGPLQTRTRTLLGVSIQIIGQCTGINIITYYAATIYQNEIGLTPFISRILAACNGTQYFVASVFSVPLVKHFNRRPLVLFTLGGMAMSMVVLAVLTSIGGTRAGIGAATFLFVFNTFFGIAFAQISWIYPAEITPLSVRTQANALSTSSNWIFNFMVVMITPIAFNNIGWRTYIIFAVLTVAAMPVVYFCYPETRGRSLEEIDLIFTSSKNIFESVKKSKTAERHFDNKGRMVRSLAVDVEQAEPSTIVPKNEAISSEHRESIRHP